MLSPIDFKNCQFAINSGSLYIKDHSLIQIKILINEQLFKLQLNKR